MNVTTNHSGGAIGSDSAWDSIGREFGITNHIHYYHQIKTPLGNTQISEIDYNEGRFVLKLLNLIGVMLIQL